MEKRKLVIDCDTGTDDAQAIFIALAYDDVDVVAITTTYGNAHLSFTAPNTLRVLKVAGRLDIPVFKGCNQSLLGVPSISDGFHGNDGLGDYIGDEKPDEQLLQTEHASLALIRLTKQYPGELIVVATGPLTNMAVALSLDPEFGKRLKHCYIMGGNTEGHGNVRLAQEFNFFCDQEAAYSVLNNLGCPITMIPLEICTENAFSWTTKIGKFVKAIEKLMNDREKKNGAEKYYAMWDQLAMAVAVDSRVVTESIEVYASVELSGSLTRGQMVVDWLRKLSRKPNVSLVTKVDQELFSKIMYKGIGVKL